jgi:hypothetical protein
MQSAIVTYLSTKDLPETWNNLASSPFLKKEILEILEQTHPCRQQYHRAKNSVFITYRLKMNVLTYSRLHLKVPMTILGLPMSVSSAGHSGTLNDAIIAHMEREAGLKLILNTNIETIDGRFSSGRTLPSAVLENRWKDFGRYLDAMRSPYRYRINKALKRSKALSKKIIGPGCFDEELYALYRNVYERSDFKLERLPIGFFQKFPGIIIRFDYREVVAGFVQIFGHKDTLYFMFGGMDYRHVKPQDLYLNMLIEIVRYGIDNGYRYIELGQTAEAIKQKLGAAPIEKHMHFSHVNPLLNWVGRQLRPLLVYRKKSETFRVFRRNP